MKGQKFKYFLSALTVLAIFLLPDSQGVVYAVDPVTIGTGVAMLAGNVMNSVGASKMNKRSIKFQREMFDKTNAYNHPTQQMARLKDAGLNPRLIYGQSSGAAAGTASQPSKPDLTNPEWGNSAIQAATGVQQARTVQSGIDVNEARTDMIKQDTANKSIDALIKANIAKQGSLDYKTAKRVQDTVVKTAEKNLENLGISGQKMSNDDSRAQAITDQTVKKIGIEIQNAQKQGKGIDYDNVMKRIDSELYKRHGVRPQDPIYYRLLGQILSNLGLDSSELGKGWDIKN
jgi:hypothetical protein